MDISLPDGRPKATFARLYSELALHKAVLHTYTKPLFSWRKALSRSHDGRTLYDFARHTPQNVERLHRALARRDFRFREGVRLHYNFNGRERTIYLYPWEERIVDLLLYRALNRWSHSLQSSASYAYRSRGFGVDVCQRKIRRALDRADGPVYGIRRDVADYFPSIDHDALLAMLEQWVEPGDYLFELLADRIRFRYRDGEDITTASRGIAFGTAIACFFANLYLTPLDRAMPRVPTLAYFRYADDIVALTPDRAAALEAADVLEGAFADLGLASKPKHHLDFVLAEAPVEDGRFAHVSALRHLGIEYGADGEVRLPRDKFRKLRNLFRFAFRRARRRIARAETPKGRAAAAIRAARDVVEKTFRSVAIIDYYLKHVTDEEQLRRLDRWLAEEVLAIAFRNGHKKGNWRHLSFAELRRMGLPSLRHRRRLLWHGHIESSFFVMRTDKLIESERGRLPGLSGS